MEDLINQLPDDCLEHIFSFLPIEERLEIEKVCKRWRKVGERGWPDKKRMSFYHKSYDMNHSILRRCGRFLRELKIWLSSENHHCLSTIIHFCRLEQLERIRIYLEPGFTQKQKELEMCNFKKLFERAKNLIVMVIYGDLEAYWIDHVNSLNPLILRELMIVNENKSISFNPDRFPNLKKLMLYNIEIDGGEISERDSLTGLKILKMANCCIPRNLIERIQNFTNLQDLILKNNICDIRNKDIREIARHCDKIKEMILIGTSSLTSECFQYLGKMPKLEILYLKDFNNVNNSDMVHLTNVRELSFNSCRGISIDDGLIQLITNSSNLEELELSYIPDLDITSIEDVQLIFHRGLRQKHLHFIIWINSNNELLGRTYPIVIDEPLLSLRVDLYG